MMQFTRVGQELPVQDGAVLPGHATRTAKPTSVSDVMGWTIYKIYGAEADEDTSSSKHDKSFSLCLGEIKSLLEKTTRA
jgi:hypothetical protein